MHRRKDHRASIILAATLAGSALGTGCVARVGYYDKDHRDYQRWDGREDRAYRHYLAERRQEYRGFPALSVAEQNDYWRWRIDHPDER